MSRLERLFKPRAITVIGVSNKPGQVGRMIFENLLRSDRPIYPVHPSEQAVLGHAVFNNIANLPSNVDVAIIATEADKAVEIAENCGRCRIPFIIPVAGGFSEADEKGKILEARLRTIVTSFGSRILGPNTLGIFAPKERVDTIFVEHGDRALGQGGSVAFISQSGSVGVESLGIESNIGFGLRAFVGLGNKVDLDEVDFLDFFRTDPSTNCVAIYMESLGNGRAFLQAARRFSIKKPIIVLKAGRTSSAKIAATSHTGQFIGSDLAIGGAFRQFGIQRAFDEEELCDASRVLSAIPPPRGNRVAIISPAGGYGVMATDEIELPDNIILQIAQFSDATKKALEIIAQRFASVRNPVDLTASVTDDMVINALSAVLSDERVDIVLCVTMFAPRGISDGLIRRIASIENPKKKPIIIVCQFGPFTDGHIRRFYDLGIIGFPSVPRAVRAIRSLVERRQILNNLTGAYTL